MGGVDTEKLKKARTDRLMGRRREVYCELIREIKI
jgi:hypothetical protein